MAIDISLSVLEVYIGRVSIRSNCLDGKLVSPSKPKTISSEFNPNTRYSTIPSEIIDDRLFLNFRKSSANNF